MAMNPDQSRGSHKPRYAWVDVVRGLGITLVFYGHYIQQGIDPHNSSATEQFRFIYSFHMPLFFMMSGFFFRPAAELFPRIRLLALRRLVPVLVFGVFLMPIWLGHEVRHGTTLQHALSHLAFDYMDGIPDLNWVTWFLVCLFVCECLALVVLSKMQGWKTQLTAGIAFLGAGLVFCQYSTVPSEGWLYVAGRSWFLSEAIVAMGFYTIGYLAFPVLKQLTGHRILSAILFIIATGMVLLSYRFNHPSTVAVMMAARVHGNGFYFVVTALAGSFAMFALAIFLQSSRLLEMIGRNTLALLGLNGLFFSYVDPKLLSLFSPSNNMLFVTLDSALITILSLLACAPLVYMLNRFVPQLIGNTAVSGPWLPALEKRRA